MEKNKVICGIASFLMGATGSAMYLIGKCKGEKKVKDKLNEKLDPLIIWQNAKIKAANSEMEFGIGRREFYASHSDQLVNLNEMHIAKLETMAKEADETKRDLNVLKEVINKD